jgi:hypothetical protein
MEAMKRATDFERFEEAWKHFLDCLEKVWKKAEREGQGGSTSFESWQSNYRQQRKKDALLSYLFQARNADQHTIRDTVEKKPAELSIEPPRSGRPGLISDLEVWSDGTCSYKHLGGRPEVIHYPARLELVQVINRGVAYPPPDDHLGIKLKTRNPIDVAEAGYRFYEGFLAAAEQRFSSP